MNDFYRQNLAVLSRLTNPLLLLLTVSLYGLGPAIAQYLGRRLPARNLWVGLLIILLIQLSAQLLLAFFHQEGDRLQPKRKLELINQEGSSIFSLRALFFTATACLTLAATFAAILLIGGNLNSIAALVLLGGSVLALAYSTPPARLRTSGFGEIILAFLISGAVPTFSYTLITGELHRLLLMSTVPLFGVLFAVQMTLSLAKYGQPEQAVHRNLLMRIGWQQTMRIHDISLILSFLVVALAFALGLPRRVALGSFIVLPLAIIEIWYFNRIRAGAPVRWRILGFNSRAMVGLMAYFALAGYLLS